MMETVQTFDESLEDGEIEDDEFYIPLSRPTPPPPQRKSGISEVQEFSEEDELVSSGDSDSDDCFKNEKQKKKRTVLLRPKPEQTAQKPKFKKYEVWANTLEEDSLTENMRGIGVAHSSRNDRNVETYDYKLKYRFEGRKRLLSDNEQSEYSEGPLHKRCRSTSTRTKRRHVRERLGQKKDGSESSDLENEPRILADLTVNESDEPSLVAREITHNLFEEKDELILRLVSVVGTRTAINLFHQTQRIEKKGGMMIVNGKRRRTPGGVYFFLLKHDNNITPDQRKIIFYEENKLAVKDKKSLQAMKREQKVEELKKRLTEQEHLPLPNLSSASSNENSVNLSNPPPSPVVEQDNSPEYKSHAINEVDKLEETVINEIERNEAVKQSRNELLYQDDFLDITCDDMEIM